LTARGAFKRETCNKGGKEGGCPSDWKEGVAVCALQKLHLKHKVMNLPLPRFPASNRNSMPMKIGLLSDTHGFYDPLIAKYFKGRDQIWHAGDLGDLSVARHLEAIAPLKAVYGNIDGGEIRHEFPEDLIFECAGMKVWMTHIGAYPPKYNILTLKKLEKIRPQLFICGHSHILKVIPDKRLGLMHFNPGAAGKHGFHKVRTLLRFEINNAQLENLEVIELGPRA